MFFRTDVTDVPPVCYSKKMLPKNQDLKQNRYRVVRQIGQSKIGGIYEAYDNVLKTNVTLKEISAESDDITTVAQLESRKAAFANEAKVLTEIKHNSILRVHDYFSEADNHYLSMEITDENNLSELLRKGTPLTLLTLLKWSDDLLDALNYLHLHPLSIIHGNIKPQNIVLTSNGKVKLFPFNISQNARAGQNTLIAEQTFDTANLHYSPLEQIWASLDPASQKVILNNYDEKSERILEQPANAETDIYALGATLYHLFTRRLPIDPLERSIDILEGKNDPLPAPHKINSAISIEVSDALMKAMEIKRENRFQSAAAMHKVLGAALAKIQAQESFKPLKNQDEEDLLEIGFVERKQPKPEHPTVKQKSLELEAEQKRQMELIKKQLQEAEVQRLKAEQRAVEAEQQLIEKETKVEKHLPQKETKKPNIENPISNEVSTITIKPADTAKLKENFVQIPPSTNILKQTDKIVSTKNHSPAAVNTLFAAPPKDNRMFRRMGAVVVVLAILGGAGWGALSFVKSKSVESNQTISSGETPASAPGTSSPAAQLTSPMTTTVEAAPAPSVEPTSETNVMPTTAEVSESAETAVAFPSVRTKSGSSSSPRGLQKQILPPKTASVQKKAVTVDDIINDN